MKSETRMLIQKLGVLSEKIRNSENVHRDSILKIIKDQGSNPEDFRNLSVSDLHVIDCIGRNAYPNVTFIAENTGLTKSAITKITTKLIKIDLISSHKKENNKKEIFFSLTQGGDDVFKVHQKFHEMKDKQILKFLMRYKLDEIKTIINFIDDLLLLP